MFLQNNPAWKVLTLETETILVIFFQPTFSNAFSSMKTCILIQMSLKSVFKGLTDNNPAVVQIRASHQTGEKPLSEPMMAYLGDAYLCLLATMGLTH